MSVTKDLLGNYSMSEDVAIDISVERYNELIKKEAILDELLKKNDVLVMLTIKNKEEK